MRVHILALHLFLQTQSAEEVGWVFLIHLTFSLVPSPVKCQDDDFSAQDGYSMSTSVFKKREIYFHSMNSITNLLKYRI